MPDAAFDAAVAELAIRGIAVSPADTPFPGLYDLHREGYSLGSSHDLTRNQVISYAMQLGMGAPLSPSPPWINLHIA